MPASANAAGYVLSRKLPSMDSYVVRDDAGNEVFGAKHHTGFKTEHWDVTDAGGSKIAVLTHERMHTHATYLLNRDGQPEVRIVKSNWMPTAETWSIDGPGGPLTLKGDLADYAWELTDAAGDGVAGFQRKIVTMHRQYSISTKGDPVLVICAALAIDAEAEEHDRDA